MKKSALFLLGCCVALRLTAGDSPWFTSVPAAEEQAKKENKLVLLNFTGLDWCVPCKEMEADIYTKPEFLNYAKKNLELVQLDFLPKKMQPDELVKANTALQEQFKVEVFPTVFLIAPDGRTLWARKGYLKGGPAAMIAELEKARAATNATPSVTPPASN